MSWSASEALQLAVEQPTPEIVIIRVAGHLDPGTAPRLARLLDVQLGSANRTASPGTPVGTAHVLVDLAEVRFFGVGGLDVLRHANHIARRGTIALHLSGLRAREEMLPSWVADLLPTFSTFASVDSALKILLRRRPARPPVTGRHPHSIVRPGSRDRAL